MNVMKMKVLEGGNSKRITLPKEWCDTENVNVGTTLHLVVAGGILVLPMRAMSNEEIDMMFSEMRTLAESVLRERGKKI